IGIGRDSIRRALALCKEHPQVYAAVGVHPTALENLSLRDWIFLEEAARDPKVVGIGETGLDYQRLDTSNAAEIKRLQTVYFLRQLSLAKTFDKPVIIHCRNAYQDTLKILQDFGRFRGESGVMHCFGADRSIAE